MKINKFLEINPYPNIEWGNKEKPIIIVDDKLYRLKDILEKRIIGEAAFIVGINEKNMEYVCSSINVKLMHFYDMKVQDISLLILIQDLEHLIIRWNTKITNLEFIKELKELKTLVLENTPKLHSLEPLSKLKKLSYLEFSGGILILTKYKH